MKRVLKTIGIILGFLILLVLVVAGIGILLGRNRTTRSYDIPVASITIPTDESASARGEHLAEAIIGCSGCHGAGLGGDPTFIDDPALGKLPAPNLTSGAAGIGATYSDEDWVRAIRHGVAPDGTPLIAMPAQHLNHLSEADLAALIAYVKQLPPIDSAETEEALTPLAYLLITAGQLDSLLPVESLDHETPFTNPPAEAANAEYGEYLMNISVCQDCHGEDLHGGQAGPNEPIAPDITQSGNLQLWSEADFITLMRTGVTPDGEQVIDFMPWRAYANMNDIELQAMWAYLQTK